MSILDQFCTDDFKFVGTFSDSLLPLHELSCNYISAVQFELGIIVCIFQLTWQISLQTTEHDCGLTHISTNVIHHKEQLVVAIGNLSALSCCSRLCLDIMSAQRLLCSNINFGQCILKCLMSDYYFKLCMYNVSVWNFAWL